MGLIEDLVSIPRIYFSKPNHEGTRIAFYYNVTGRYEIFSLDLASGELEQITDKDLPQSIREKFLWSHDDEWIIFPYDDSGNEHYEFKRIHIKTREVENLGLDPAHDQVLMDSSPCTPYITFCSTRNGQLNIYRVDVDGDNLIQLTDYENATTGGKISPDGDHITFSTNQMEHHLNRDIYMCKSDGSDPHKLVSMKPGSRDIFGSWSEDGGSISLSSNVSGYFRPAILDLGSQEVRWFGGYERDEYAFGMTEDRLLVMKNYEGTMVPITYDILSGSAEELVILPGLVDFINLVDETLFYTNNTSTSPSLLCRYHLSSHQRTVLLDPAKTLFDGDLVADQHIWYPSTDGTLIPAIVYLPSENQWTGSYPAMVIPHGGPTSQHYRDFNVTGQILASKGIISIFPNVRGSTGYGNALRDACIRDWGGKDLQDWIACHEWLVEHGADADRIGLYGGSYGGFGVLSCMTKSPELWQMGVAFAPLTDMFTVYQASSENYKKWLEIQMGSPSEHENLWKERSPINYVQNISAPLLLLHGIHDPRFAVEESRNLRRRLIELGKIEGEDFEYVEFNHMGHGSSDLDDQLRFYELILDFIERRL